MLADPDWREREGAWTSNMTLHRLGWTWASLIGARLERPERGERMLFSRLKQWEEAGERPPPRTLLVDPADARAKLDRLTGRAEAREGQRAMAEAVTQVFAPKPAKGAPNLLLAEAGTGIGKTLAYLAPASVWAEQSGGTVWVSTFTKALQRQLDGEGPKLFADADERARRIVVRKGRENYLCLLNLEDALQGAFAGRAAILAQLVGRWAAYTKDGDMVGGDLPGWLPSLFRRAGAAALTDRRGECVYAGCPHYRRCFIERAERASRDADIVIANHALVMVNAARAREDAPGRILFDEGHHLFDAADSTFAVAFGGQEAIELRRWIVGPEGRSRGRRRGLAARLMDVASYDEEGARALDAAVEAAKALPSDGWLQRLVEGAPFGPIEALARRGPRHRLRAVEGAGGGLRAGDRARRAGRRRWCRRPPRRPSCSKRCRSRSRRWRGGSRRCSKMRRTGSIRRRGRGSKARSAACRGGARRSPRGLRCSRGSAARPIPSSSTGSRSSASTGANMTSRSTAAGSTRPSRWRAAVLAPADGVLVTSATLRGGEDWAAAEARTGALHLPHAGRHFEAESPFDYAGCSEVLIVTDVKPGDIASLAGAYARLIEAARRRHARAVHRHPAAEGGPRADRRPAGARRAAAARAACRSDRRGDAGRHLPRRSARLAARHRCAARRRRRARRIASAGGDGARAVAAADRAPRGAADGRRRQRL